MSPVKGRPQAVDIKPHPLSHFFRCIKDILISICIFHINYPRILVG